MVAEGIELMPVRPRVEYRRLRTPFGVVVNTPACADFLQAQGVPDEGIQSLKITIADSPGIRIPLLTDGLLGAYNPNKHEILLYIGNIWNFHSRFQPGFRLASRQAWHDANRRLRNELKHAADLSDKTLQEARSTPLVKAVAAGSGLAVGGAVLKFRKNPLLLIASIAGVALASAATFYAVDPLERRTRRLVHESEVDINRNSLLQFIPKD